MEIANNEIRKSIEESNLKYWQVANEVGISDGRLSVWLRTPLKSNRKKRVEQAIKELSESITEK